MTESIDFHTGAFTQQPRSHTRLYYRTTWWVTIPSLMTTYNIQFSVIRGLHTSSLRSVPASMCSACDCAGGHPDAVVVLRPLERWSVRGVAGRDLHWRDQLPGPGKMSALQNASPRVYSTAECPWTSNIELRNIMHVNVDLVNLR